jgi:FKBP-type peptidyl-prolyl cis-trans isomerase (trigger factor)
MTKNEAIINEVAQALTDLTDFDLPKWVIKEHAKIAVESYLDGLQLSQDFAMSGAHIGENAFHYPRPRAL